MEVGVFLYFKERAIRLIQILVLLISLAMIVQFELLWIERIKNPAPITAYENEESSFREMNLGENGVFYVRELSKNTKEDFEKVMSICLIYCKYDLSDKKLESVDESLYKKLNQYYKEHYKKELKTLEKSIKAIFCDLKYFPIPVSTRKNSSWINYVNSWGYQRTYGGNRTHEGTDLMADNNMRGYFPVVSMTDGVIENVGWLEKGGYRIGIRGGNGGYFYYAHLYSYDENIKEGSKVSAGQVIGYMGDSGYSKVEGTTGNFDVHLHMGIYISTDNHQELSINPYWILKSIEGRKLSFSY